MGNKPYIHPRQYSDFMGIDLASSRLSLAPQFATIAKNGIRIKGSTDYSCRWGFKAVGRDFNASAGPGFGNFRFNNVDVDTGAVTEDLLSIDPDTQKFWVLRSKTVTLTTASANVLVSFYPTTAGIHTFYIHNTSGTLLFSHACDSSKGVPSQTVSQLNTAINGAGLSITAALGTAAGTEMVSNFLPIISERPLNSTIGTLTLTGEQYVEALRPTSASWPLSGWDAKAATDEAELPSSINAQNCLYLSTGYDDMLKYDGQYIYKAGMPSASSISATCVVAGAETGGAAPNVLAIGNYAYAAAYEQTDAKGNVIEGLGWATPSISNASNAGGPAVSPITGADKVLPLTVSNIAASSGYNTNCAIVNGTHTLISALGVPNLTITVDNGSGGTHTLQVGDIATFRFLGAATGIYNYLGKARVTAVTSTTITLEDSFGLTLLSSANVGGVAQPNQRAVAYVEEKDITAAQMFALYGEVTIGDNNVISNQLVINIYRNKGAGLSSSELNHYSFTWYLCDIVPNNSFTSTQAVTDYRPDALLGPAWEQKIAISNLIWPTRANTSTVRGKYLTELEGRMYIGGDPSAQNTLYRTDVLYGYEYVDPTAIDDLDMSSTLGDVIAGVHGAHDSVVVGKTFSVREITGDLGTSTNIVVREISQNLGVISHDSMRSQLNEFMWATPFGPVIYSQGTGIRFLGPTEDNKRSRIEGAFKNSRADLKRATAIIHPEEGLYIIFIPNKWMTAPNDNFSALSGFRKFLNNQTSISDYSFGTTYVFDFNSGAWINWTNIEATGGFALRERRLYWSRATYSAGASGYTGWTFRQNDSATIRDYVDWNDPIAWEYATYWETLGEKDAPKNFLRAKIESTGERALSGNAMSFSCTTEINYIENVTHSSDTLMLTEGSAPFEDEMKISTNKAKSMRLRLASSTMYTRPTFSGLSSEIAAPFRPKFKVP